MSDDSDHDASKGPDEKGADIIVIRGRTEDGQGLGVARLREGRVEAGIVQPLQDGKPIQGEVVKLRPFPKCPLVCEVEKVELPATGVHVARRNSLPVSEPTSAASATLDRPTRAGPAQVATDKYRENWDAIWARPKLPKKALPS